MSVVLSSARVLGIPELLAHIFLLSSRQANTVYARVCKEWSDVALDVLWREINNPSHLIQLLCPLHPEPDGDGGVIWSFVKEHGAIQTTDWARLRSYAKRVRILVVPRRIPILDDSVFTEIQRAGRFLPNLQRLEWYTNAFYYPLFTDKNVLHLTLRLDPEDTHHLSQIILDIPKFLPLLTSLMLELPDYYAYFGMDMLKRFFSTLEDVHNAIAISLTKLPSLTYFSLPKFFCTPTILQQLAMLKKLVSVEVSLLSSPYNSIFPVDLETRSFMSLTRLAFSMSFERAMECFSQTNYPPNIIRLELASTAFEPEPDYSGILEVLSASYPDLEELVLDSTVSPPVDIELAVQTEITLHSLQPVLRWSGLKVLKLRHYFPFSLTHDDILAFAKALPSIEILLLNPSPGALLQPSFPIGTLLVFETHCPRLQHLGLYFGIGTEHIPVAVVERCLSKLLTLDLGASRADPSLDIGCLFNDICPKALVSYSSNRAGEYSVLGARIAKEWAEELENRDIWRLADIYSDEQMKTANLAHVVPPRHRREMLKEYFYQQEKEKLVREKKVLREEAYQDGLEAMTLDGALHEGDEEGQIDA
ncbi:hypothetical protein PLEOSDRAFT_1107561 [Pleurotus ostreatus PC15]|uniref:Uncharacterized protein n=1 Tax=Pleurotus ostreatus (strain PC15) TaxID=1137138 RepID=A0A067N9B7_PLEO1|nr:hypothetical protein PLEOSDRAFT_1107561 [Pleurotus ostreatus PC15]